MDTYDVIVIGTGAGGGMVIKTLCEAGLKVCALNAGRQLDPAKDFRQQIGLGIDCQLLLPRLYAVYLLHVVFHLPNPRPWPHAH